MNEANEKQAVAGATSRRTTFTVACRDYFGLRPNQTMMEFGRELRALSAGDQAEIRKGLELQGFEIVPSPAWKAQAS